MLSHSNLFIGTEVDELFTWYTLYYQRAYSIIEINNILALFISAFITVNNMLVQYNLLYKQLVQILSTLGKN